LNGDVLNLEDYFLNQQIFLICNGPSVKEIDVEPLKQRLTFGMNNGGILRPTFWTAQDPSDKFLDSIWRDPTIIKFIPFGAKTGHFWDSVKNTVSDETIADCPNIVWHRKDTYRNSDGWLTHDKISWGVPKNKGHRSNTMVAALHIIWFLGFRTVFILGADFHMDAKNPYFFPVDMCVEKTSGNNNLYSLTNQYFNKLQPRFLESGFNVFNCTPNSGLTAFPYIEYCEALDRTKICGCKDTRTSYKIRKSPIVRKLETPIATLVDGFTVITPTGDRPESFEICCALMAKQTVKPTQWIIVDDGITDDIKIPDFPFVQYIKRCREKREPHHTLPLQMKVALSHVKTNKIIIMEDDDWYKSDYFEWAVEKLNTYTMVGLQHNKYYYIKDREYCTHVNTKHSSFCSTSFQFSVCKRIMSMRNDSPYIDLSLWRGAGKNVQQGVFKETDVFVLGIKGLPGRRGVTYASNKGVLKRAIIKDRDLAYFKSVVGDDINLYERYL
jgi:hypothetical protein